MKKLIYYMLLAMSLFMVGCSEDQVLVDNNQPEIGQLGELVQITVGMPQNNDSRLSYQDKSPNFTWEAGDKLTVLGFDGTTYKGKSEFALIGDAGKSSAIFEGSVLVGATKYVVYYQTPNLTFSEQGVPSVSYAEQTQTGNNSTAHLKNYLYLGSNEVSKDIFIAGNIKLNMLNSLFRFNVKQVPAGLKDANSLTWLINAYSIYEQTLSLRLNDIDITKPSSLYLCFDPSSMEIKQKGKIIIQFNGTDSYQVRATSKSDSKYSAGHRYEAILQTEAAAKTLCSWNTLPKPNEILVKVTPGDSPLVPQNTTGMKRDEQAIEGTDYWWRYSTTNNEPLTMVPDTLFKDRGISGYETGNDNILEVILPENITQIGKEAFKGCKYLSIINIPTSVNTIKYAAFNDCDRLVSVKLHEGLTTIGDYAFRGCDFQEVNLPQTLTSLGQGTFIWCTSLKSVKIPNKITTLNGSTFRGCTLLESVVLPKDLTKINNDFEGCTNLKTINLLETKVKEMYGTFHGCKTLNLTSIPETVEVIGSETFLGCTNVTFTSLPNSITRINNNAFNGCTGITFNTLPTELTYIGYSAFEGCTGITFSSLPSKVNTIDLKAFKGCSQISINSVPASLTTLMDSTFVGCTGITSFSFHENTATLNKGVFAGSGIQTLEIPCDFKEIKANALGKCTALTNLKMLAIKTDKITADSFKDIKGKDIKDYTSIDLTLHESWKADVNEAEKTWLGYTWKSITFGKSDKDTGVDIDPLNPYQPIF